MKKMEIGNSLAVYWSMEKSGDLLAPSVLRNLVAILIKEHRTNQKYCRATPYISHNRRNVHNRYRPPTPIPQRLKRPTTLIPYPNLSPPIPIPQDSIQIRLVPIRQYPQRV